LYKFICVLGLGSVTVFSAEARVASAPFEKGLTFMRDKDILVTGDKWTLAVNIALDDYVFNSRYEIYFNPNLEKC
jgi:hypothetical protein